jgi:hypothetical protein
MIQSSVLMRVHPRVLARSERALVASAFERALSGRDRADGWIEITAALAFTRPSNDDWLGCPG